MGRRGGAQVACSAGDGGAAGRKKTPAKQRKEADSTLGGAFDATTGTGGGAGTESGSQSTLGGVIDTSATSTGSAGVSGPSTLGGTFDTSTRGGAGAGSGSQSTLGGVIDASAAAQSLAAQDAQADAGGAAPAGTSGTLEQGVDQAAEAAKEGVDRAEEYVDDPSRAVDDAADALESGVDRAAEGVSQGLDKAREFADDPQKAVEDAAEGVQQGVEELAARVDEGGLERNLDGAARQVEGLVGAAQERLEGLMEGAPQEAKDVMQSVADAASDSLKRTQATADSVRKDMETPGPAAPFAGTPLTSLPPTPPGKDTPEVGFYKKRLIYSVAGLDRGFAANKGAVLAVEGAIYSLVGAAGGSPTLTWTPKEGSTEGESGSTMGLLSGTWRLVYSSAFASGSLGGLRPGPQAALIPVTIGQVYQVIRTSTASLDNVVEFYAAVNLPSLPGGPKSEPVVTTLTLRHGLEVLAGSTVRITFEDTEVKATGGLGGVLGRLPEFTLPQLPEPFKPSRSQRSSNFEVVFLDADLRITRGDRGELRVFVRT